jgi:RimJ/RimL family protein N-acetyltransferase
MGRPAEELCGDGLTLRRWRTEDESALYEAVSSSLAHLAPWMPWCREGYSQAGARKFLELVDSQWRSGEAFDYAIVAPGGRIVGGCGLMARLGPGALEIGYWLRRDHTGRGLASRAATLLVCEAFRIGTRRVGIIHAERNRPSRAVPERLGFTEVGRRPSADPAIPGSDIIWRLDAPPPTG